MERYKRNLIDKILDKYYSKKLINEIHWCFIPEGLDYKVKFDKTAFHEFTIYVKQEKYKDECYEPIIHFCCTDAITHLMRLDKTLETVNEAIREYLIWNR